MKTVPKQKQRARHAALLSGVQGYLAQIAGNCEAIAATAAVTGGREGSGQAPVDEEFVHQARVAVRRLRASLKFLRRLSGFGYPPLLDDELKFLFASLGHVRDWDVFVGGALSRLPSAGLTADALQGIHAAAAAARARAYADLRVMLHSARYDRLLLDVAKLLDDGQFSHKRHWIADQDARALLHRQHRQLLRDVKKIRGGRPEEWHQLRIDIKKLRYASEFFVAILQDKRSRRYIKVLAQAQDMLGELNDLAQAARLASELFDAGALDAHQYVFINSHVAVRSSLLRRPAWKKITALAQVDAPWRK